MLKCIALLLAALLCCPAVAGAADNNGKILVAYFSATGTTRTVAHRIAEILGADEFEIQPTQPYSAGDLDWTNDNSRCSLEHKNPAARPAVAKKVDNIKQYKTVFIGYPIWWGEAPNIVRTFVEENDLSGMTVVPFCTHGGGGMARSGQHLSKFASKQSKWLKGGSFYRSDSLEEMTERLGSWGFEAK